MKSTLFRTIIIIGSLGLMVFDGVLLGKIYKQLPSVKGAQYKIPIRRDDMQFNSPNLKYYYEPIPDQTQVHQPDWFGYNTENFINADGLNDSKNYEAAKRPGVYRIAAIGDSFTYGLFVNTKENWTEIMEEMLNSKIKCPLTDNIEIINFGVLGYDIEYITERYARRGYKYNSDLVLWLMNGSTFEVVNELAYPYLEEYGMKKVPIFDPKTKRFTRFDVSLEDVFKKYGKSYITEYQKKRLERLDGLTKGKLLIVPFNMNDWARNKWNELKSVLKNPYGYADGPLEFLQDDYYKPISKFVAV